MKPYRVTFLISDSVHLAVVVTAAYGGSAQVKALNRLVDEYPRFTYEVDKASRECRVEVVEL